MKKSQVFTPDVRNLGGRKLLVNHMYNHRLSLGSIKPLVGSFEIPPSMAKKGIKHSVSQKQIEDYQNLMIMKMKISTVKKSIDNNKPVSFDLIRQGQPGGATSKQYQFMQEEHFKNLLGQKRQIEAFGTMNDRKKNINDFIAYPPRFFRRLDNGQMHLYNSMMHEQRSFQNSTLSLQNRPKTAQVRNQQDQVNNYQYVQHNGNIYIQDPNGQLIQQEYGVELTPEQQQMLLQQHLLYGSADYQDSPNHQQLLYQQIQQANSQSEQLQNQQNIQDNQQQQLVKPNMQIYNGLNHENNSISSAGNAIISPSATTATAGFSSQLKGSPFQSDINQNSQYQSVKNYQNQPVEFPHNHNQGQHLVNAQNNNANSSVNKFNNLIGKQNRIKSAGPKYSQNQNNSNNKSSSDKSKKSLGSGASKKTSQKSLTIDQDNIDKSKMNEEQKWVTIIEEIPVLLDANEESLKALKMHLINIIIEFRLYRITDYENMREIFIQKNKDISQELASEIFSEIIDALNE